MTETQLKTKVLRKIKETYPDAFVWKISDKWTAGIPDVLVIVQGRHIFLELKTDRGVVSRIQRWTMDRINACRGNAYVVRSVEQAINVINDVLQYGISKRGGE